LGGFAQEKNVEEKYTRYGIDWQNEVMKNPKMMIVQMLRRVAMERDELQRRPTKRGADVKPRRVVKAKSRNASRG
jgi:hypothetical protein